MKYKTYYCASHALSELMITLLSFFPAVFFLATEFPKYYI